MVSLLQIANVLRVRRLVHFHHAGIRIDEVELGVPQRLVPSRNQHVHLLGRLPEGVRQLVPGNKR